MKTNFSEGLIAASIILFGLTLVSFSLGNQFNEPAHSNFTAKSHQVMVNPDLIIKRDSLVAEMERKVNEASKDKKISKEIEQALEIALSETDKALSTQIVNEVNQALAEVDIQKVINVSLKEAQKGLKEAILEIKKDTINEEISKALKEAHLEILAEMDSVDLECDDEFGKEVAKQSLKAASAGIEIAAKVLEGLDIEKIITESLNASEKAISIANESINNIDVDSMVAKENVKNKDKEMSDKEKEKLKKEIKKLKKELEEMKKELKKEFKDKD